MKNLVSLLLTTLGWVAKQIRLTTLLPIENSCMAAIQNNDIVVLPKC